MKWITIRVGVYLTCIKILINLLTVNLFQLNSGLGYGWISPTLETLLGHPDSVIPLTSADSSLITSLQEAGRIAGCILAILLLDKIGRRKSLVISCTMFLVQWLLIWLTKSVWIICLSRFLYGSASGLLNTSSSIYIAENSWPKNRGVFASLMVSFFYLGMLGSYLLINYLPYYDVALANCIINGVTLVTSILLKEPVQHLIMKDELKKAKKNFQWLHGHSSSNGDNNADENDQQIPEELATIQENIRKEQERKKSTIKLLTTPFIYKIIIMIFIHYTLTQATGFSAVNSYATISFSNSRYFTRKEFTVFLGVMQLIAVSLSSLFIERFNRKTIMRTSYGLAALVHLCSAVLFYTHQYVGPVTNFSLYIFTSISSFSVIYALGILPTYSLIRGEVFPQSIKAIGGCVAITGNSLMGVFTNFMYLRVAQQYSLCVNYLFFSICSFITVLYVHFVLPETKGKTLVEIQKSIDKKFIDDERNQTFTNKKS